MKKNFLMAVAVAGLMMACSGHDAQDLTGAGATFPQPLYNALFERFTEISGDRVSYGGVGSGTGIRNLRDKIVDFAGSDAYMSDEEMEEFGGVVHVPSCLGGIALVYNLEGVEELNLSGEVVADIFAGRVARWNDGRIAALNPDKALPDEPIVPVYRSDGSGSTFVFTDYLSKVSGRWAEEFGRSKTVNFPVGQAGKGNPGVASIVGQTRYAIGYVGTEYALSQGLAVAKIGNKRGEFVEPTAESISASASGSIPDDTRASITDSDAPGAYPISCFTWIIVYKEQNYADRSLAQARATVEMLRFVLSEEAQAMTSEVNYAPLPEGVRQQSLENLKAITFDGKPIMDE